MRTIRRLYFYAVALISLEVVLWGLIILLRSMLAGNLIVPGAELLAQALALILVGMPIFVLHWLWCQRAARQDGEEHSASLRAIFLYGVLLATLVPLAQNTLALFDQLLVSGAGLEVSRAVLGAGQSWRDNLIAILFNGVAAFYFLRVLQADGRFLAAPAGATAAENFAGPRRLYRYLWVLYGLLLTLFGLQQVLSFLLYAPSTLLGAPGRELLLNGLALIAVGAPLWTWRWSVCQKALAEPAEQGSMLRLGVLYLLTLGALAVVLSSAGIVVDVLLRLALGESLGVTDLLSQLRGPLSIGLPLAGVWAYYGLWLGDEINSLSDALLRANLRRFYFYLLAAVGLALTFIGLSLLLSFFVDLWISGALWGDTLRPRLAGALASLLVGLPLWLLTWRPMQAESLAGGEAGDLARRSLLRKIYLYLAIFATLIGAMVSGGMLAYQVLVALLSQTRPESLSTLFNLLQALALFIAFLAYHFVALRRDGGQAADALAARHARFAVLVLEQQGSGFAAPVIAAIHQAAAGIPLALQVVEQGIPVAADGAQAVVFSSALALDPPEALRLWLKEYAGQKIMVPVEAKTWFWPGGVPRNAAAQAAQIIRQLADGQEVRPPAGVAAWQVLAYIFAALFALQVAFVLLALGLSLVMR